MVRWLERNGYDVSYFTGVDSDRLGRGAPRAQGVPVRRARRVLVRRPARQRRGGARRRRAPGLLQRQRGLLEDPLGDDDGTATLVSYKETHANAKIDPLPDVWTGTWRDPRFSPPADGGRPENALTGTIVHGQLRHARDRGPGGRRQAAASGAAPRPRACRPARRRDAPRRTRSATSGTRIPTTASRPAGLVRLSSTTADGRRDAPGLRLDLRVRQRDAPPDPLPRHERSGPDALVFGAGTVQWSWGLDGNHDPRRRRPRARDAAGDVQPVRRHGRPAGHAAGRPAARGGRRPTRSRRPPTITAPGDDRRHGRDAADRPAGTATDRGGGVVGAVEVSVDGGPTWHPATGRDDLDATRGRPRSSGSVTPLARAADDSGNLTGADQSSLPPGGGSPAPPGTPVPAGGTRRAARVVDVLTTARPGVPQGQRPAAVRLPDRARDCRCGCACG